MIRARINMTILTLTCQHFFPTFSGSRRPSSQLPANCHRLAVVLYEHVSYLHVKTFIQGQLKIYSALFNKKACLFLCYMYRSVLFFISFFRYCDHWFPHHLFIGFYSPSVFTRVRSQKQKEQRSILSIIQSLKCQSLNNVQVQVTLQLTVSQSVSLGVIIITVWHLRSSFCGRPLWREDESAFCICCWSLPVQSFSGPSPLGLVTIFYYIRFDISLFVAFHGSEDNGGGILPASKVKVKVILRRTVSQSVGLAVEPHSGLMTRYLLLFDSCFCRAPSLTRGRVCLLYMLLALASSVFLGSKSLGARDHILHSQS
jgi:hypothetical protein